MLDDRLEEDPFMSLAELRFALRSLLRRPGFTFVAVFVLALGIGANTAIWSFADAVAFRALPVRDADRLVAPFATDRDGELLGFSFPDYLDLRGGLTGVEELALFIERPATLTRAGGRPELAWTMLVSESYFPLLGVEPAAGRLFDPAEAGTDGRGGAPVAVLSHRAWQRRFGADPGVVGRTVAINGHPFTIIGVAGDGFLGTRLFSYAPEVWVPVSQHAAIVADAVDAAGASRWLESRASGSFHLVGRLAPGVSRSEAEAEIAVAVERFGAQHPEGARRTGVRLFSNRTAINPWASSPEQLRGIALLALAGVAVVLLVACANVANLVLVRSSGRIRELALRSSLGAGRGALVRQLLAESLVLALAGGVGGLLVGWLGSRGIGRLLPRLEYDLAVDPRLDGRALLFTLGAALLAALASGLLPALRSSRVDLASPLRGGSAAGVTAGQRLRNGLVVAQVAFSVVVLVAGGLFVRSLQAARGMDLGFRPEGAVVFGVDALLVGHDREETAALEQRLAERLAAIPGVRGVTWADDLPLDGNSSTVELGVVGRPREENVRAHYQSIVPGYFEVLGVPLVEGRLPNEADRSRTPEPVVVSSAFAATLLNGTGSALGKVLQLGSGTRYEVVGVVGDAKVNWLGESPEPVVYFDRRRDLWGRAWYVLRYDGAPAGVAGAVQAAVASVDPQLPATRLETLTEHLAAAYAPATNGAWLAGAFGLLALALAAAGVYGVIAYSVAQRVREMAIRMAVGAAPSRVVRELLARAGRLLAVGLVAGLAGAWGVGRLIAGFLYGVSASDPVTLGAVTLALAAVGALACLVPARRALRVEPATALRAEA
jgi:predicted permease